MGTAKPQLLLLLCDILAAAACLDTLTQTAQIHYHVMIKTTNKRHQRYDNDNSDA